MRLKFGPVSSVSGVRFEGLYKESRIAKTPSSNDQIRTATAAWYSELNNIVVVQIGKNKP